jgi:hypothetical protein
MDERIRWLLANSDLTTAAAMQFVADIFLLGVEAAEYREELDSDAIEEARAEYERIMGEEVADNPIDELARLKADPNSWLNASGITSSWPNTSNDPPELPKLRIVTKDEGGHTDD